MALLNGLVLLADSIQVHRALAPTVFSQPLTPTVRTSMRTELRNSVLEFHSRERLLRLERLAPSQAKRSWAFRRSKSGFFP